MLDPLLVPATTPALPVASTPAEGAGADVTSASVTSASAPAPGPFTVLAGGVIPEPRNGAETTGGIAVIESMLAEAEARRGFDEEETW
jgi:hypothetical protein